MTFDSQVFYFFTDKNSCWPHTMNPRWPPYRGK